MEEDFGLFIGDDEISVASDVASDDDLVDDQFEEVVVYDDGDLHQEIQFRLGGYEYEFVDEVLPSQKCPVCLLTMRDAVQTSVCGHRFCRDCLHGILRSDNPICPNDRQEIEEEHGFFTDKAWTRDILSLRVKCKQSKRGCDWIGEVRHAEEHQRDCPYEDTACSGCGENIQRRLLETHLDDECPKRIVECAFCQDEFYFIQKQEHEEKYCKRFPLPCKNNCGHKNIPREEDKRAYLNDHNEATLEDHLEMAWGALVSTKRELDSLKDLRQKFHESEENNKGLKKSMEACQDEILNLNHAVASLQLVTLKQREMMKEMEKKMEENVEKLASKVRRSIEVGQLKTQRTLVKRKPTPDEVSYAPSFDDVRKGATDTPGRCKSDVNEYRNCLSISVHPCQSLKGPVVSCSPQETRSSSLGPRFKSSDWASSVQKEINRK
ncbi:TNF receptor-associated factor 4-like isoform X2 [Acropora muricata]|uniref:TNF receptor-associated factor 4-like isoform X2 n=1 Tax=Acropora muricata TaxID=159855 RepID=UPI0034E4DB92